MSVAAQGRTQDWLDRDEAALAGVLPRVFDVVIDRGEGSWLIDVDGGRYLDLTSGVAVTNVGHCHPRVVAAVQEQAARLVHTSVVAHNQPSIHLAERIRDLVPYLDDPQVFFCNSGAEAVDGALKLGRRVTGRPGVIAFRRAFHGRTLAATSLTTAKARYRDGYEPLLPSVHVAPWGDLDGLDDLLRLQAPPPNVGVVIVEPVLGEGGYLPPPDGWLEGLRSRCDDGGMLLVFDEVQCGMGRTGRPFAAETFDVVPDILLFAKGVASGLPLGGIVAPRRVLEQWPTAAHGSTFGGNPVACAAAIATLDVLEDDGLYARTRMLGERLLRRLREIEAASVVDVRGIGLMVGVQLRDAATASRVQRACLEAGVLVLTCGPADDVLRLIPPLTISDDELEHGLAVLKEAMQG